MVHWQRYCCGLVLAQLAWNLPLEFVGNLSSSISWKVLPGKVSLRALPHKTSKGIWGCEGKLVAVGSSWSLMQGKPMPGAGTRPLGSSRSNNTQELGSKICILLQWFSTVLYWQSFSASWKTKHLKNFHFHKAGKKGEFGTEKQYIHYGYKPIQILLSEMVLNPTACDFGTGQQKETRKTLRRMLLKNWVDSFFLLPVLLPTPKVNDALKESEETD